MATVNNQSALDAYTREALRIIDEQSETTKLVAEKLRSVVEKLFTGYEKQYNINDFDFLVQDLDQVNAFYIPNTKTQNHKHIICVNNALIAECKTEDEFAGVIGHELGHFTYKYILGENENTTAQERFADLHTMDLMLGAGYDPAAYESFASKNFAGVSFDIADALGVHGNEYSRKEDVRAYLTKLHQDRGNFGTKFDPADWHKFQNDFQASFDKNRYVSFLDKKMMETLGTTKLTPENMNDFLDMLDRDATGAHELFSEPVRRDSVALKLSNAKHEFGDEVNGKIYPNRAPDQKRVQKLAQDIFNAVPDFENTSFILKQLVYYNAGRFAPFAYTQIADIFQRFIDAPDKETALKAAKDWYKYSLLSRNIWGGKLSDIKTIFQMPAFQMPYLKDAIGKPHPRWRHDQWYDEMQRQKNINQNFEFLYSDVALEWPGGRNYICAVKDGIIILTGPEATKYNEQASKIHAAQKQENDYRAYLDFLNLLAEFDDGKKTADDVLAAYKQNFGKDILKEDVADILNGNKVFADPKYVDYRALKDLVVRSPAYKKFAGVGTSLQDEMEHRRKTDSEYCYEQDFINKVFSVTANPDCKLVDVLIKLATETHSTRLFKNLYSNILPFGQDTSRVLQDIIRERQERNQENVRNKFLECATYDDIFYFAYSNHCGVGDLLDKQLRDNKIPNVLDIMFGKMGEHYKQPGLTKPENAAAFNKNRGFFTDDVLWGYYVVYCLAHGFDIGGLDEFLDNNQKRYKTRNDWDRKYLAKYIKEQNLFPTDDFRRAFRIYQKMERGEWFSPDESNQTVLLNILIRHIKTMSRDDREKYSFVLLSGVYPENVGGAYVRKNRDLRFPQQKNELMNIFVDAIYEEFGKDNGSYTYADNISDIVNLLNGSRYSFEKRYGEIHETVGENFLGSVDQAKLCRMLSDKIVSQADLSRAFQNQTKVAINDKDVQDNKTLVQGFEAFLAILAANEDLSQATIEFLNRRLTDKSISDYLLAFRPKTIIDKTKKYHSKEFIDYIQNYRPGISKEYAEKYLNKEYLELVYNSFWDQGLGARAVVMNKLLNRISNASDEEQILKDQIAYVCNMHFPAGAKYRDDAMLIFDTVIKSFQPYERSLILAAIASANQNRDDEHKNAATSVGAGLRMFFENMGPAWVKFGQLMSYVPELPTEIRTDLGKLKDNADVPARWELFDSLRATLPNELQKNIVSVDEILGAGSFWVTAKVQYVDTKTGQVNARVLSLLRPFARERSMAGFDVIESAVKKLATQDPKYQPLLKVAQQARASAEYEVDVVHGNMQCEKAKELYGGLSVQVNGETFNPLVADWKYYGVGKDQVAYKLMDLARGKTLDRATDDENEKRKMALAYVTTELAVLFRGDVWDIDRHMGQQNFEKMGGLYYINIYDTGAQIKKAPNATDKLLLVNVLYGLVMGVRSGRKLDDQILKSIRHLDSLEQKHGVDINYVTEIQKGLMALSDIIEYQKEEKDADGNIIKPSLRLSAEDLANAVMAAYDSPTTDAQIKMMLAGMVFAKRGVINRLRNFRRILGSNKTEWDKTQGVPVTVSAGVSCAVSNAIHMDKDETEIREHIGAENAEKILGINKRFVKQPGATMDEGTLRNLVLQRGLQIA